MELFKLPQEHGESMVLYSNRILDIAEKCDLNDITQKEIMAMVFITHCRSPQFRKELRRHGVGVTRQFIRKEAQGWDRSQRCEEQSNKKPTRLRGTPRKRKTEAKPKINAQTILPRRKSLLTRSSKGNADDAAAQSTLSKTAK